MPYILIQIARQLETIGKYPKYAMQQLTQVIGAIIQCDKWPINHKLSSNSRKLKAM